MYKKYFYKSPAFLAILLIVATMWIRIGWMGKGVYAFSDETRYEAAQQLVGQLLQGHYETAFRALLKTDARPADGLLHAVPALIQHLTLHAQGINHPDSLIFVQYFHVLIFGLLAWVFYWLTALFFPHGKYDPLFALSCFLLLVNNHVHARHILPYDAALLLSLIALALIVRAHQKKGIASSAVKCLTGALAALAWLTYPGYYWMPVLMMGYIVLASGQRQYVAGLKEISPFLIGGLLMFLPFEAVYWYFGKSLVYGLAGLSLGINQGDYHESLEFLIVYMKNTNGIVGWILAYAFLILGALNLLKLISRRMPVFDPLQVFLGIAFGAWLFHMLLGEVFEFMVFYGRLVHAFLPFMVWALLAVCIRLGWLAMPVFSLILLGSLFSFWKFNETYRNVTYPRDVLYDYSVYQSSNKTVPVLELTKGKATPDRYCNIHVPYAYYDLADRKIADSLFFYNTAILYPIEGQDVVECAKAGQSVLLKVPYYLCFTPYGYEGYSPQARKSLQSGLYTTQVQIKKTIR
ncbi:MAG: hypothetical protein JWO58_888 [Chitinophagaceae bacterium]|nr:hypothetical protein [Chitinophagaceae bacterium]